jgi:hypothetical protein
MTEVIKSEKKIINGMKLAVDSKIFKAKKTLDEESSYENEIEEPKDTIASLFLGYKRTPSKKEL